MRRLAAAWCLFLLSASTAAQSMPEVWSLRFEGNRVLGSDALRSVIVTRETPGSFWKFLYRHVSEKLGEKPEYYDPLVFEGDLIRLRKFYRDQGFFQSRVDTSITEDREAGRIHLLFRIEEGARSFIDTLEYVGLEGLPTVLLDEITGDPLVQAGDPYVVELVEQELRRIISAFLNNGYGTVQVDPVSVRHYASTNNMAIRFVFRPGNRYRFGVVQVLQDTAGGRKIDGDVVRAHLDFREGDFFSEARKGESERNLNRLGVFETSRIEPLPPLILNGTYEIPINVTVRTRPFHELSPEIGANDEDRAFNALVGLGYSNRNFFGGARNLNLRTRVSVQNIQEIDLPGVLFRRGIRDSSLISKIELASEIVQPYFFSNKTRVTASLAYILEKQRLYLADILRGRLGVSAQLARYTRGSIDWNLERIKPEALDAAAEAVLIIRDDLKPQFNSIITATLQRDRRNDIFSPSEGSFYSLSIEEAGLLPKAFGALGGDLPFSRYYKIWGSGQWYWDASGVRDLIWALRVSGGFAELFGGSTSPVPLTRRFYAGGGGSVRGWRSRSLGAVLDANQGGNALFETNLEARWNLLKNAGRFLFIDLANISFVGFLDAGNVWTEVRRMRGKELAVASGIGLRWNTIAGPIRIDIALRMYDPFEAEGRQWVTQRRFFHETYSLVQFGIGHAF